MQIIDKSKPVLVTGATGYVAGWIVKRLLDEGITVHAAVRNPNDKEKLKYLDELASKSTGKIIYFKADLLQEGSYLQAMQGCELVYHTASPFIVKVKDNQKDLVDPALKGTRNVLESVNKTNTVKRVVLTSSVAAIYGDNIDAQKVPNKTFTEENWNTSSTLNHQTYSYSKLVAEKEAWEINKKQNRWDLVVINPSLVLGPGINPKITSESYRIVKQLGNGTTKTGAPQFYISVVDVRDLAEAHYKAGFTPTASGRHIISAEDTSFIKMASLLREKYGDAFPFPKRVLPKTLIWLAAPFVGYERKMIQQNVGHKAFMDNGKSIRELGMKYRPLKESITDFFQQMIDNKLIRSKK